MARGFRLGFVFSVVIAASLMLPALVRAPDTVLGPESYHNKTYSLEKGDIIDWTWEVVGEGTIDFWIEDNQGTRHGFLDNARISDGWFTVPEDGDWTITFHNENTSSGVTVDLEYDVIPVGDVEDLLSGLALSLAITGIIVVVILVVAVYLITKKTEPKKPQIPPQQQPPQYPPSQ